MIPLCDYKNFTYINLLEKIVIVTKIIGGEYLQGMLVIVKLNFLYNLVGPCRSPKSWISCWTHILFDIEGLAPNKNLHIKSSWACDSWHFYRIFKHRWGFQVMSSYLLIDVNMKFFILRIILFFTSLLLGYRYVVCEDWFSYFMSEVPGLTDNQYAPKRPEKVVGNHRLKDG